MTPSCHKIIVINSRKNFQPIFRHLNLRLSINVPITVQLAKILFVLFYNVDVVPKRSKAFAFNAGIRLPFSSKIYPLLSKKFSLGMIVISCHFYKKKTYIMTLFLPRRNVYFVGSILLQREITLKNRCVVCCQERFLLQCHTILRALFADNRKNGFCGQYRTKRKFADALKSTLLR